MSNLLDNRRIGLALLAALAVATCAGAPGQAAQIIRHGGRHAGGTTHSNGRAIAGLHHDRQRAARANHQAGFAGGRRRLP